VDVGALKSQQHRWAKGLTECFLKLMPLLWRSRLPLRKKLDGTFHLGANLAFPASLFMTVITLPVMLLRLQGRAAGAVATAVDAAVFLLVIVTQLLFYAVATREVHGRWVERLRWLPFFPLVGVGLAINNARGVLEALLGHRTEFVRTPKLGVLGRDVSAVRARARTYLAPKDWLQPALETGLAVWYVWMAFVQMRHGMAVGGILTAVLSAGLFTMGGASIRSLLLRRASAPGPVLPAGTA
jgi:hypothetical protein